METLLPDDVLDLARRVVEENARLGRTVALAESCTGGLVCAAITEIPGSSAVLDRGFVTYSNEAKQQALGVSPDIIDSLGAVSIATAWAMAQGALKHSQADVAVSISGVAGPGGGSDLKPVGTVVFAKAERGKDDVNAEQKVFPDEGRGAIRYRAVLTALELLLP